MLRLSSSSFAIGISSGVILVCSSWLGVMSGDLCLAALFSKIISMSKSLAHPRDNFFGTLIPSCKSIARVFGTKLLATPLVFAGLLEIFILSSILAILRNGHHCSK